MATPRTPKGPSTKRRFNDALTIRWEDGQLDTITRAAELARIPRERFIRNTTVEAAEKVIKEHNQ